MAASMYTAKAPVNIAVIKYWGKRNDDLIIPVNDSVSVTVSMDEMCAKTTVACSEYFDSDRMWLNGKEEDMKTTRLQNCINEMKKRARKKKNIDWHLHISSENNFPTAAGLASSAAGFACLVKALAALYDVEGDLSAVARQGSGSACRSIFGGFVHWQAGVQDDGSDSLSKQIASKNHWPEMRVLILVVNAGAKDVPSTKGMKQSILTSSLLQYRVSNIVPARVKEITKAILEKDFQTFAEITIKDSNQFHAICLDTYPPIHYLNSTSYKIIQLVHAYNKFHGKNKMAYTFDAGPNACLYLLDENVAEVLALVKSVFPSSENGSLVVKGLNAPYDGDIQLLLKCINLIPCSDALHYVISSQVGDGAELLEDKNEHLLNESGLPFKTSSGCK